MFYLLSICLFSLLVVRATSQNFSIVNGQILTPGLAIIDSPQPFTPEGGDFLQVAIDVTGNGRFGLPPYMTDFNTGFFNVTIFLSSYDTGLNLTITNGTASAGNASLGDIIYQEPGSTVKHVNWIWPSCLVGDGDGDSKNNSRGEYNITIQQNFRLNGSDHFTIFDLPISVSNTISEDPTRPSCEELNNPLLSDPFNASSAVIPIPYLNGAGVDTTAKSGIGAAKRPASPSDGLGSGAVKRINTRTLFLALTFGISINFALVVLPLYFFS